MHLKLKKIELPKNEYSKDKKKILGNEKVMIRERKMNVTPRKLSRT